MGLLDCYATTGSVAYIDESGPITSRWIFAARLCIQAPLQLSPSKPVVNSDCSCSSSSSSSRSNDRLDSALGHNAQLARRSVVTRTIIVSIASSRRQQTVPLSSQRLSCHRRGCRCCSLSAYLLAVRCPPTTNTQVQCSPLESVKHIDPTSLCLPRNCPRRDACAACLPL